MPNKQIQGQSLVMNKVGNCSTVLLLTPVKREGWITGTAWFSERPASANFHLVEYPAGGMDGAAGEFLINLGCCF